MWKGYRFARSREDAILFKSLIKKTGVPVIPITEPAQDAPTGKLLEAIIEILAESIPPTWPRKFSVACEKRPAVAYTSPAEPPIASGG